MSLKAPQVTEGERGQKQTAGGMKPLLGMDIQRWAGCLSNSFYHAPSLKAFSSQFKSHVVCWVISL